MLKTTPAKLINLCSGDMAFIESYAADLSVLLAGPLCLILAFYLLYQIIGIATVYGLCIVVLLLVPQFPINALILLSDCKLPSPLIEG